MTADLSIETVEVSEVWYIIGISVSAACFLGLMITCSLILCCKKKPNKAALKAMIINRIGDFSYDEIADYTNSNNIPWYFSIIAKTDAEKKTIVKFCSTKQIINFNWPDLPKKNINKRTKSIYNKLICKTLISFGIMSVVK